MRRAYLLLLLGALAGCSDNDSDVCKQNPAACQQGEAGLDLQAADLPSVPSDLARRDLSAMDAAAADQTVDGSSTIDAGKPYQHEDITPQTLNSWINAGKAMTLIDVREPAEYAGGHIKGAINLAWSSGVLKQSLAQVPKSLPVVVYCASGSRANQAATYLVGQGYQPVYDAGGISAWIAAGYPIE